MIVELKQRDSFPPLRLRLTNSDGTIPVLTGATITLVIGGIGTRTMVLVDAAQGILRYDWTATDTQQAGAFVAEVKIIYPGTARQTIPTVGHILIRIHPEVIV